MTDASRRGDHDIAEQNRQAFNSAATTAPLDASSALRARQIMQVIETLTPRKLMADIGCNTGRYMDLYSKIPGVEQIEGFDIAESAIALVKKKGYQAHVWVGGSEPCPAQDNRYDLIVAGDVIEHIVNTEFFLKEIHRILKPGGRAIITTPNLYYWISRLKFLFHQAPWNYPGVSSEFKKDRNVINEHIRIHGMSEWSSFFEARGFQTVHSQGLLWVAPTSLKNKLIYWIDRLMPASAQCLSLFVIQKK